MLLSRAQFADPAMRYGGAPLPVSWSNLALGVVISLALHGLLIACFRTGWLPRTMHDTQPPPPMTVWLRMEPPPAPPQPLPPPPVVLTEPVLPPLPMVRPTIRQPRELPRKPDKLEKKSAPAMTWVAPPASKPASKPDNAAPSATEPRAGPADPFYPSAPASPGRFDVEAARRAARKFADEPDPAKAGTALAQLPPKSLAAETPLARSIRAAGRGDCKDGIPGGLLAPLLLALDKKDHGCKW